MSKRLRPDWKCPACGKSIGFSKSPARIAWWTEIDPVRGYRRWAGVCFACRTTLVFVDRQGPLVATCEGKDLPRVKL